MKDVTFEASVELKEGLTFEAKTRNFSLMIDEPENLGGKDKGPNPVEYLLVALGGCLGIVIQVVAKEMNLKINGIKINLKGELNPLRFMGKDFSERAGYKKINVEVEIHSDESKEKLQELIKKVEERCPISDNIRNVTPVNIVLK
ncbi:MAG: OsmC family protein [Caldisericia bacterium]|nr:OsmC family protein [Caldisericia bacterium]